MREIDRPETVVVPMQPDPYAQPAPVVVNVVQQQQQQQPVASPYGGAVMVVAPPSPAPTIIGILMLIGGGLGVILVIVNLTSVERSLHDFNELGIEVSVGWLWISHLIDLVAQGIFLGGGIMLLQRKKLGIWLGFASIGVAIVNGIIGSIVMAGAMEQLAEGAGAIAGGVGIIGTIFCNLLCAGIVAIPLMISTSNLE